MDKVSQSLPDTIEKALDEPPICMISKVVESKSIEAFLAIELTKLKSMVNVDDRLNLQSHQIPMIANELLKRFSNESLADFVICFRNGALGKYDEKLLRVDGAIIFTWMGKYLEEKYNALESKLMAEKDKSVNFDMTKEELAEFNRRMDEWKATLGHSETKSDNSEENEYQREKLKRVPLDEQTIKAKQLHLEWIKENFDPLTGKRKQGFIDEPTWLKQQTK